MYFFKARTANRNYYVKANKAIHNRNTMAKIISIDFGDEVYVDGFKPISIVEYLFGRWMTK